VSASDRRCYSTSVAFAQEAFAQEAFAQEAFAQEAELQEAELQEAELQDALDHDALDHEAEFHEAFELAVAYQALALNSGLPVALFTDTNWFRPAFGFARPEALAAAAPLTTPTPRAPAEAYLAGTETVCMIAPLTWSGVQLGCLAMIAAAIPETTGAANDVPDIHM